jgi:hypothetical protein
MSYVANISAIKNVPLNINMASLFNDYINVFVGGKIGTSSVSYTIPSWLTITQTEDVDVLGLPFSNLDDNISYYTYLINSTDYLKQFTINITTAGQYRLYFYTFKKSEIPASPISVSVGIINISVVNPPPPLVYNNAGIVYNKYDRVIRVEKNKTTEVYFGTDGLFPNGEQLIINSTLPAWITNNTIGLYTQFWTLSPTSTGTFYYNASAYLRNTFEGDAAITVIVVDSLFEEIDNCCSDENVNIVWLNRQGGRGNFIFTQRKDFNVEIGKKSTYLTNDIKRYSEIKNVHNGFKVYSTGLSLNQIDFLDTLRYSIQCWQYINGVFIPLILDIGSFEKYNTKENMYEISMNFLYAERLNIQRQ